MKHIGLISLVTILYAFHGFDGANAMNLNKFSEEDVRDDPPKVEPSRGALDIWLSTTSL